ncbi:MAG: DUF86 domain-containing protein [Clostridiales bacterium]|nr:DUF86 domain-containing protein [Clostridiales bacterium]
MNSRDRQICDKILSEIAVAEELLRGVSPEAFICDERTVRAVCMTLINIGELVKNLTPELKQAHRNIPWRAISGMRDITAHRYQTLRKEDVYSTCADDLPIFEEQLLCLIREEQNII